MTTATLSTSRSERRIEPAAAADMILRHRQGVLPELALFDVRDAQRYASGHIHGAEHLTEANFPVFTRRVSRSTPVLIYCHHGNASRTWASMFADFRFAEVYSVDGGHEMLSAALAAREAGQQPCSAPSALSAGLSGYLAGHGFDPADLNAPRMHGLTPLMRAALDGRTPLVEELIAAGVDLNRRNMDGNNALWLACVSGSGEVVRALAAAGIGLDNRNDMGATALMYTASSGKDDMVALLLELGADPGIVNFDDARAIDLASTLPCLKLLKRAAS